MKVFGSATLVALLGSGVLTAGAGADPTGTPPSISPAADLTTTSPQSGDTLTEVPAQWSGTPTTVTIQWFDCDDTGNNCTPVASDGTGTAYTLTPGDVGSKIEVQETDMDPTGTTTLASGKTVVVGLPPAHMSLPTISGTAQQGQTLTETNGGWSNNPTSFAYQWLDCDSSGNNCAPVAANGNSSTYLLTLNDAGSTIRVQETASNAGGDGTPADSASTAVVMPLPPVHQTLPTISGTAQQGQTLTETNGTWSNNPTSFGHQWLRCDNTGNNCANIHNAIGQSYTLTSADVNNTIAVEETASNTGGAGTAVDSGATAVVTPVNSTTTSLLALPASSVTNQASTLVATVTSSSGATPPVGAVTFRDAGAPIIGCSSVGVATPNQSVNVTCPTAFSASTSPELLTAVFTPAAGSSLTGSTSQPVTVVVGQDSTSTSLDVSNPTVKVGSNAKYTATVAGAHAGPFKPSGSVQFFDHGELIASCSNQALVLGQAFDSAQCTVRYTKVRSHAITARYGGDAGFGGSTSSAQAVAVRSVPPRVLGTIKSKMAWKFRFTPASTTVLAMVVRQARAGTKITITCRGRGCPFARRSLMVTKATGCTGRNNHRCLSQRDKTVNLAPEFGGHPLPAGSHVTIELTHPSWIGKAYVFTIRAGKAPSDRIGCLAIGSTRPGARC